LSCQKETTPLPKAIQGVFDLRDYDLNSNQILDLKGEWNFSWSEFTDPNQVFSNSTNSIKTNLPHFFSEVSLENQSNLPNDGYATYSLKILINHSNQRLGLKLGIINTAYTVFINGKKYLSVGQIGTTKQESIPSYKPSTIEFDLDTPEIDLVIHVSNFHNRYGGMRTVPSLSTYQKIKTDRERKISFDMIIFGSLLIISIYQLILFFLLRQDKSTLYFACYALLYSIKTLFEGERLFFLFFPNFPWELDLKISYWVVYTAPFLFSNYLASVFQGLVSKWFTKLTLYISIVLNTIVFFTPAIFYSKIALYHQIYIILLGVYGTYILINAVKQKREGSLTLLIAFIIFFLLAGVNDTLYSAGIIKSLYLSTYALVFFILMQAITIAIKFSSAFIRIEILKTNLQDSFTASSRFIPKEFLSFLGKDDITKIQIGDQLEKNLTVLFADIRSFTELSEKMSAKENFNFVNSYLARMNPVIERNNGFIDKFIGDAIMALFTNADDALTASIEMIDEISIYNIHRAALQYPPIQIGIGLNTGNVMMGTVGNDQRMDTTVIGDTVNLAARIESINKEYKTNVLISDFTYKALEFKEKYELREIDTVNVKGKSIPVALYECFNFDDMKLRQLKRLSHPSILIGLSLKNAESFEDAILEFQRAKEIAPNDIIPQIQIEKCKKAILENHLKSSISIKNILLIDEDKNLFSQLKDELNHDISLEHAVSLEQALELIKNKNFDFLIMNLFEDKDKEFEFLGIIKRYKQKVIYLGENNSPNFINELKSFRVNYYLLRPIKISKLVEIIKK
jgi:class 3 adenylate cyclase/AmiR/NasT family two-component response regulator